MPLDGPDIAIEEDPSNAGFPNIRADLSSVTAVNINDLREALALQRYAEARARYGSRYVEYLRACGVRSSDARLGRPEYLGGGTVPLSISEILQTAPETATPGATDYGVGDLYGHGIAAMRANRYVRFFEEHGHVLSLLSVRPKAMYMDGMDRLWLKSVREDYWQKELQHIGQQEVWNGELFADVNIAKNIFGYQDRYREYRYQQSSVASEFRTTLNYWHMGRPFGVAPTLNESFINCVPTKRVYAEQTQNDLWVMVNHDCRARRLVSRNATPRVL